MILSRMAMTLRSFSAKFNNQPVQVSKLTIPGITPQTEEYDSGTGLGTVPLDTGRIEPIEVPIVFKQYHKEVYRKLGVGLEYNRLKYNGVQQLHAVVSPVFLDMEGWVLGVGEEEWGEKIAEPQAKFRAMKLKLSIDGEELIHIDYDLRIYKVGGVERGMQALVILNA